MVRLVVLLLLVASAALAQQQSHSPERREAQESRSSPALLLLGGLAARSALLTLARGRPPPLRPIIGQREEAQLVDQAPPGALGLTVRALRLLVIFLPPILLSWLAFILPPFREKVWYAMVTSSLASAGTAFIKWGQWASCRPDVFPTSLCAALSRLHSQAPRHRFSHTKAAVEEALGGNPLDECFESFERQPLASGSIAQVHRARYRGRDVAVKVRHPNVVKQIVTDFILMCAPADLPPDGLTEPTFRPLAILAPVLASPH
eukprot:scaffold231771_cov31-Tisochrysis_lutea.AAC.6